MLVDYGRNRGLIDTSEGFQVHIPKEGGEDEGVSCPHCGVEINGQDSVTITGDAIYCKCGELLLSKSTRSDTPHEEDTDAVNRQEWGEAWGQLFNPEEGDMDYETD